MRRPIPFLMGALLVGLLGAGCSSGTDDTTTSSETTAPDSTTTTVPTTTTEAVVADASCVACHTDQATLQALAVEPVETESLSEGEG